jgi:hyperosmotically inducible periplasmic protein
MTTRLTSITAAAALALLAAAAHAQSAAPAPDNSKANANSMNSTDSTSTADGQSNNAADISLAQQIRKSVTADKSLSTYAHNVKIVAVNGAVTLNGVVRDSREKAAVATKAQAIAGKGNVTDDLTIAPAK